MRFPVAIEPGTDSTAFGVVFPDLPGCFSAADTLDEAMCAAREAATAWLDAALVAGEAIPMASGLDDMRGDPAYAGWMIAVVSVAPRDQTTPHGSRGGTA